MDKTIAVLYHGDADGFGAAYAAWLKLGNSAEYIKVQYGQPFPALPMNVNEVYILDFSYTSEILDEVGKRVDKLVVIDHHKTAEEQLKGRPDCIFDMNKSGCVLAYEYFNPEDKIPQMLRYIQDRDLWRFHLEDSEAVNAYIYTLPEEFEVWHNFNLGVAITSGKSIISYRDMIIKQAVKSAVLIKFAGHAVPLVNTSTLPSEIGNELCKAYGSPFSITYCDRLKDNVRTYSLRSIGEFDVSEIAKRHGGGGHKNAAGFTIGINNILGGE